MPETLRRRVAAGLQDLQEERDTSDVDADAAALMLELRGTAASPGDFPGTKYLPVIKHGLLENTR